MFIFGFILAEMLYEKDFSFIEKCPAQEVNLSPGQYKFEVWGAGNYDTSNGGYSVGTIDIWTPTKFYVVVGGKGNEGKGEVIEGGCNGGGSGLSAGWIALVPVQTGGGGTDIRALENDIYHRIIVAGGAGGGSGKNENDGGGYSGKTYEGTLDNGMGNPATMKGPGIGCISGSTTCNNGKFGYGGNQTEEDGGGGGGGWYGGASGSEYGHVWRGAGGGSGFVLNSSTKAFCPSEYKLTNNKEFYFKDASTKTGENPGNGKAKITMLKRFITPAPTPSIPPPTTPLYTPSDTPIETPFTTPLTTPEITPYSSPFVTPEITPFTTPFVTPEITPFITLQATQQENIQNSPNTNNTNNNPNTNTNNNNDNESNNEKSSEESSSSPVSNNNNNNNDSNEGNNAPSKSNKSTITIMIVVVVVVIVLFIIALVVIFVILKKRSNKSASGSSSFVDDNPILLPNIVSINPDTTATNPFDVTSATAFDTLDNTDSIIYASSDDNNEDSFYII